MTSVVSRRAFASPVAVPLLVLVDMQQECLAEPRLLALSGTDAAVGNCRKVLEPSAPEWPAGAFMRMVGGSVLFTCATLFIRWIERLSLTQKVIFERGSSSCYRCEPQVGRRL